MSFGFSTIIVSSSIRFEARFYQYFLQRMTVNCTHCASSISVGWNLAIRSHHYDFADDHDPIRGCSARCSVAIGSFSISLAIYAWPKSSKKWMLVVESFLFVSEHTFHRSAGPRKQIFWNPNSVPCIFHRIWFGIRTVGLEMRHQSCRCTDY